MKLLQCSPGNKACGKRCVPNKHKCKGEGKAKSKGLSTGAKIGIGVGSAALLVGAAAIIAITSGANNQTSPPEAESNTNFNDQPMGSLAEDYALNKEQRDKLFDSGFTKEELYEIHSTLSPLDKKKKDVTDLIAEGKIPNEISDLLVKRGLDKKIAIVDVPYDVGKVSLKTEEILYDKIQGGDRCYVSKDTDPLIIVRESRYDNDQFIKAVQSTGWAMDDEKYLNLIQDTKNPEVSEFNKYNNWYIKGLTEEAPEVEHLVRRAIFERKWLSNPKHYGDFSKE